MTKINSTVNKVLNTIRKYDMICPGDRVLVGLSGGKDSVALLHILNTLSSILKIDLFALHINHGIRGKEADRDQQFAEEFSKKFGISFKSVKVNVPELSKNSEEGTEAVARKIRYEKFFELSGEFLCNKIATAHTACDNSETYFITLLRNSNAKGIPPVRDNIIRPLIDLTTNEVLEYCDLNNLSYVTDSTNRDDAYTRNYLRNNVIPSFAKINPNVDECIARDWEIKRSYEALCEIERKKYFLSEENPLSLTSLQKLCKNIAYKNVLFLVLKQEAMKYEVEISYSQFLQIEALICQGNVGQMIELEKNMVVYRNYNELEFRKKCDFLPDDYKIIIQHGKNTIPESNMVLYLETEEEYNKRQNNEQSLIKINKLTKNVLFKYNIINSCLYARSRKAGDAYTCNSMTKKIKKYMIDEKIPADIRSRIPVVCDENGIIWVPGLGMADRIKESQGEVCSLCLEFKN